MEHTLTTFRYPAGSSPHARQYRFLMVEDNPGDADFVRAIVTDNFKCSFQLDHEVRLGQALARLTSAEYDLALLDLNLPDSQGLETFVRIHNTAPCLPIVILTGEDDLEQSLAAVRFGAQDYLCKDSMSGGQLVRSLRFAMERQSALLEATTKATTDSLTGLRNRRGLTEVATQIFAASRRVDSTITLLSIDLDGLKWINDTLGHKAGDQALIETAEVLQASLRECDIIARLGGDEFVVLAIGTSPRSEAEVQQAITLKLQKGIAERNNLPGRAYCLSLSTGTVKFDPERHATLDDLLREADQRMYEQKRTKQRNSLPVLNLQPAREQPETIGIT